MTDAIRFPLYAPLLQRDATSEKDALATNIFYDSVESVTYATKRPGIDTYASGLGQGLGIYFYDDELFIFQGVDNTTWTNTVAGNGLVVTKQWSALNDGTNYTSRGVLSTTTGYRWKSTSLPQNWKFSGMAFGNGIFVISAEFKDPITTPPVLSDKFYYSSDGYSWSETNTVGSSTGILYLNNRFFALGNFSYNSKPKYSFDGITWVDYTGSQGITLGTTTWNGSVYCSADSLAGSSVVIKTSPDALTWTTQSPIAGTHGLIYSIASKTSTGTMVIAEGDNVIDYSTDNGVSWTTVTLPTINSGDECKKVLFVNNLFVVLTDGGAMLTSPDGITWTFKSYVLGVPGSSFESFAYANGRYIVTLLTSTNAFYYSTDLLTWVIGNLRAPTTATISTI